MASSAEPTELRGLIDDLNRQKEAIEEALRRAQERMGSAFPPASPTHAPIAPPSLRHYSLPQSPTQLSLSSPPLKPHLRNQSTGFSTLESSSGSRLTGDDSDDDEDQNLYAQDVLPQESYEDDAFREHLRSYPWDVDGKKVLQALAEDKLLLARKHLILPGKGCLPDRSDHSHHQIYDVGNDGSPLLVEVKNEDVTNGPTALWQTIKSVNPSSRQRKAVGRITIVREPAPVLFGALHFTMQKHFDVDELFKHLVEAESTWCDFGGAFDKDPRQQRSFAFVFEYFTLIDKNCQPMPWQIADAAKERKADHIAITRCSSIVALSLSGEPMKKFRNPDRRAGATHGCVYDPWAPYHVLNIQCYPDLESSLDVHNSTQHHVNGVEAFLVTVLGEYKDAEKRFENIFTRITKLITPPLEVMFDNDLRDKLLFEDDQYTYSRRYFWAFQTLGIMINSMQAMVDSYEDNLTTEVWEGRHRTVWPLIEPDSPRNRYFKKRMSALRKKFDDQLARIRKLIAEYEKRRADTVGLREQLFSGTSLQEARNSVQQAKITVQQGHNIKLLTLVNLFFLPLTFVTSVFGMTNMDPDDSFWRFAAAIVAICVPCFILVGSLNSTAGMQWWRDKASAVWKQIARIWTKRPSEDLSTLSRATTMTTSNGSDGYPLQRGITTNEKMAMRLRRLSSSRNGGRDKVPQVREMISEEPNAAIDRDNQSGDTRREEPTATSDRAPPQRLVQLWKDEARKQQGS